MPAQHTQALLQKNRMVSANYQDIDAFTGETTNDIDTFANGDVWRIELTEVSTDVWDIDYLVNGVVKASHTNKDWVWNARTYVDISMTIYQPGGELEFDNYLYEQS